MHGNDILDDFVKDLTGPCRVTRGEQVLACVSGGIDSMVLLDLLCRAAPLLDLGLGVIHVDHGLRGTSSGQDARFVEERCRRLSLPFHLARLGMGPHASNLEERAREKRYHAILDCLSRNGYGCAATGHTLDDQAETVIYRIVRGTGLRGLSGMAHRRDDGVIRPLLGIARARIEEYAARIDLEHVQDTSNDDTHHARNLIRLSIMPLMRRINQRAAQAVSSLAAIASQEGDLMDALSAELARKALAFDWEMIRAFRTETLREAHESVLRRFLIDTVTSMTGEPRGIDAAQVEAALRVVGGHVSAHTVRRKVRICRDNDLLVFHLLSGGTCYRHPIDRGGDFHIPEINKSVRIVPAGEYPGRPVLRPWRPGDRMRGRRVADMLSAMRVPRSLRPFWPVLESDCVLAVASPGENQAAPHLIVDLGHGE